MVMPLRSNTPMARAAAIAIPPGRNAPVLNIKPLPPVPAAPAQGPDTVAQVAPTPAPPTNIHSIGFTGIGPVATGGSGGNAQFNPDGSVKTVGTIAPDAAAPVEMDIDVLTNGLKWDEAFRKVGKIEWKTDTHHTPNFYPVYHGLGTIARGQVLFVQASPNYQNREVYRTALNSYEAALAKTQGWTPTEWRINQQLQLLIGTTDDPGDAPLGNDGLPIGYGSAVGYGNGGVPTQTPGGQPLGPNGEVTAPTPGPEGLGGTITSKPPTPTTIAPTKLPPLPRPVATSSMGTVTVVLGAALAVYAISKLA